MPVRSTYAPAHARHVGFALLALVAAAAFLLVVSPAALALTPHEDKQIDTYTCAACHSLHAATDRALLRTDEANDPVTRSCLSCHDGSESATNVASGDEDSFGLPSGHSLEPTSTGPADVRTCATCHDVHGSSSANRMIPARQINGETGLSSGPGLCMTCHNSENAWYGLGYAATSTPTRDATGYPVSGTWPGPDTYLSGQNAHRLIPETTQTVGVSEPLRRQQGDCLYCHSAHRGPNAYDGLVTTFTVPAQSTLASDQADGSYAALCFSCHSDTVRSGFTTAPVDIKQFATGEGSAGHRIETSGGVLPVGAPLPCFECHNPHGSKRGNASMLSDERGASLSTTSPAGVRAFCFTCHTTSDTSAGWDGESSAYAPVGALDEVVGLTRSGPLRLVTSDGHAEGDSASCYECHGNSYTVGGNNVHAPLDFETLEAASYAQSSEPESATVEASIPAMESVEPSGVAESVDSSAAVEALDQTPTVEATGSVPDSSPLSTPMVPLPPSDSLPLTGSVGMLLSAGRLRRRDADLQLTIQDPGTPP